MEFQTHAEHLAWRANPGNGTALVGTVYETHWVLVVNPTAEQISRHASYGGEAYLMPEKDAAALDGKDWQEPLPPSAKRAKYTAN